MAARSKTKAEEAIAALRNETGRSAIFLQLDLADLASVRRSADEFLSLEPQLNTLFNSGCAASSGRGVSALTLTRAAA